MHLHRFSSYFWGVGLCLALPSLALAQAGEAPSEPADGSAEPADQDAKRQALKYFKLGLELFNDRKYDPALAQFLRSKKLYSTQVALRNAAICLEQLSRNDEALELYDELMAKHGSELNSETRTEVEADQARVARLVGQLTVKVDLPGARVTIDSRERGQSPIDEPLKVNSGTHVLRVSLPGYSPFETKFIISAEEDKEIAVRLNQPSTAPAASPAVGTSPNTPPAQTSAKPSPALSQQPATADEVGMPSYIPWLVLGAGAAGLTAGGTFYFLARGEQDDLKQNCDNNACTPNYRGDVDSYHQKRTFAYVGLGVGAAGLATGAALLASRYWGGEDTSSAQIQPWVLGTHLGLQGSF